MGIPAFSKVCSSWLYPTPVDLRLLCYGSCPVSAPEADLWLSCDGSRAIALLLALVLWLLWYASCPKSTLGGGLRLLCCGSCTIRPREGFAALVLRLPC